MSFINFLDLTDTGYGNHAKGILYVIYELLWKLVGSIGKLVDAIVGLFYKLAGLDYLGSGSEELVEQTDLLSQIFNQNIVSTLSIFMIFASVTLMVVFGAGAVIKRLYFSKDEVKPTVDIIKNMVLAGIFLIFLTPIALFAISSISTVTSAIASLFGSDMNVSLADVMLNASFSGDPVEAYNAVYSDTVANWTNITNWTEMSRNDFLFELEYSGKSTIEFYWYIYLLGGGFVLYNVVVIALNLVKRIFNVIVLYLIGPIYVAKMVDDGGLKFKEWKNKAMGELISIVGTVVGFMLLLSLVGVINDLELIKQVAVNEGVSGELGVSGLIEENINESNPTILLINNLTKMLLLMAGTSVAKDSGQLLADLFKTTNEEGNSWLEGIYEKLSRKEVNPSGGSGAPRTRVITKNTTTTRRIIDYSQDIPSVSQNNDKSHVNISNNQKNNFNTVVNNVDRKVTNLQNRTNVSLSGGGTSQVGVAKGSFKSMDGDGELSNQANPADVLNKTFARYKDENNQLRNEWAFMKNGVSSNSRQVVRDFETASKDLDASLASGERKKIDESMSKYVSAYRKEEKVAKEGYRDFAGKSAKLSNDLTLKQQAELKKISEAYKKAQVDYGKTARKLSKVSEGNMSAAEALRVKERADKQREKLMAASSKANAFYNNQKKGA